MKLSAESTLIDRGIDVGLDYEGTAPDLGWKEYDEKTVAIETIYNTTLKIDHVGNIISVRCDEPLAQVAVYDMRGNIIAERTGYSKHFNIDVVKSNLYLVRVVHNGHSLGYKIK